MEPVKAEKLWKLVYTQLQKEIFDMAPGENRLPSEEELSRNLGISRATVREALQALIADGYVTRRHGKGNFGHPSVQRLQSRIDQVEDFIQLLSTPQAQATCRCLRAEYGAPSQGMWRYFPVAVEQVYRQTWVYSLEGRPRIVCRLETPAALLKSSPPVFETVQPEQLYLRPWLESHCETDIAYISASMACGTDKEAAALFSLDEHHAMMTWREIVYDLQDAPITYVDVFFHPEEHLSLSMRL